jgi:hypothetical protein
MFQLNGPSGYKTCPANRGQTMRDCNSSPRWANKELSQLLCFTFHFSRMQYSEYRFWYCTVGTPKLKLIDLLLELICADKQVTCPTMDVIPYYGHNSESTRSRQCILYFVSHSTYQECNIASTDFDIAQLGTPELKHCIQFWSWSVPCRMIV